MRLCTNVSGILTKFLIPGPYYRWGANSVLPTLKHAEIVQVRYAARKGTREKRKKLAKSAKVEKKVETSVPNWQLKAKLKLSTGPRRMGDFWKSDSIDNVWISKYHKLKVYSFAEAVHCHRETHHPTMYNVPNGPLNAFIELDMRAAKQNKFMDNIRRMVYIPHPFDLGEDRSVLVFCKTLEFQKAALEAGATLCGGSELIKDVQKGEVSVQDFEFVLAHPEILPELVTVRGLMKRNFPGTRNGTLGPNLPEMVSRFKHGIRLKSSKSEIEQDYGWIDTPIGFLDTEISNLEENLAAILKEVNSQRPKREGPFISRCFLICAPSRERLKVNIDPYLITDNAEKKEEVEEEEEEDSDVGKAEQKSAAASA